MSGSMPQYQMNAGMAPQQPMMQQRMHQQQQNPAGMSVSTPQRPFNPAQGTPGGTMPSQQGQQYSTPQPHGTPQSQTPTNALPAAPSVGTPQTPTFPSNPGQQGQANGAPGVASAPQSPGTESLEKERFALILDINQELLYEIMVLSHTRQELKKEHEAAAASGQQNGEINYAQEDEIIRNEYNQ